METGEVTVTQIIRQLQPSEISAQINAVDSQVTQPKHAAAFSNGMEYFNTYGGCTVASAAGMATLRVIQEERFQERAARVGKYLTAKLNALKEVGSAPRSLKPGGKVAASVLHCGASDRSRFDLFKLLIGLNMSVLHTLKKWCFTSLAPCNRRQADVFDSCPQVIAQTAVIP